MRVRIQPKGAKGVILVVVIIAAAVIVGMLTGFASTRTALKIGYVGNNGWSSWSGSYITLDGNMKKTIHPSGDTLDISVKTKSGKISIEIRDSGGNLIFDENDIGTKSFSVGVSGSVTAFIEAEDHKGSFSISG